ncbi:MAG: Gldg family protein [Oligoflexus sp.]
MSPQRKLLSIQFGVLATIIIGIAIISSRFYFRIDMTEDDLYTLSEGSQRIVANLEEPVTATLYFSKSLKDLPLPFKTYGTRVEEILRELTSHSGKQLKLKVIDPKPDSEEEVLARKYGIQGLQMASGDEAYLGLVFVTSEAELAIPYLDPRKEEFVEYEIAEALVKMHQKEKPRLGIFASLPIETNGFDPSQRFNHQQRNWSFVSNLRNSFDLEFLSPEAQNLPPELSVVLLFHPKNMSEQLERAIDQYLLKGGRLIVAVDPFSRLDLARQQQTMMQTGQMPSVSSHLERLFAAWGVEFQHDQMLGDMNRATRISIGNLATDYPFFLSLTSDDMSKENKMTANLKQMLFAEPGWFVLKHDTSKVQAEVLLQSSEKSGAINIAMAAFLNPNELAKKLETSDSKRHLAVILQGHFKSAFADEDKEKASDFLAESEKEGVIILMSDVDFLHDSNSIDRIPFINQVIVRPRNDNINFIVNAAEMLGGSEELISIRTSGRVQRPFDRVRELQQAAQQRWKTEEENLSAELQSLQKKLADLQSQRTESNSSDLAAAQQEEIRKFRQEEAEIRTRRRQVRQSLRQEIESLEHRLVALNLIFVPGLVSGLGIYMFWRREKRARGEGSKR